MFLLNSTFAMRFFFPVRAWHPNKMRLKRSETPAKKRFNELNIRFLFVNLVFCSLMGWLNAFMQLKQVFNRLSPISNFSRRRWQNKVQCHAPRANEIQSLNRSVCLTDAQKYTRASNCVGLLFNSARSASFVGSCPGPNDF